MSNRFLKIGLSNPLMHCLVNVVSAGVIFGFGTGLNDVISHSLAAEKVFADDDEIYKGILISSILFGAFFASVFSGLAADKFGRKPVLITSAVLGILGNLITILVISTDKWVAVIGRFILGLCVGSSATVSTILLSETASSKKRGYGVFFQFAITLSLFLAAFGIIYRNAINFYTNNILLFIPLITFAISSLTIVESPIFLVGKDDKLAKQILTKISENEEKADEIIENVKKSMNRKSSWSDIFDRRNLKPISIGLIMAISQQLTGINIIIYYFVVIVKKYIGNNAFTGDNGNRNIGFMKAVMMFWNFLTSAVSIPLITRYGRRTLMLVGQGMMMASMLVSTIVTFVNSSSSNWLILVGFIFFILGFEISIGPLFFVVINEIFSIDTKGKFAAFINSLMWLFNAVLTLSFSLSSEANDFIAYFFLAFFIMGILTWAFQFLYLPETKDKEFEEIQQILNKKKKASGDIDI